MTSLLSSIGKQISLFGESYQNWISDLQAKLGPVSMIFIVIALALIGGFGITRFCKLLKIPYVTGYIILGILLGPSLLAFIPTNLLIGDSTAGFAGLSFVSDLTMGFIAFGCGRFFKLDNIKNAGVKVILVSAFAAITIGLLTGIISYLIYGLAFGKANEYGLAPAFLFGACAACISPTATSSIIRQYKAKGSFVERIFQNILIANIVAILAFSIILGLVSSGVLGGVTGSTKEIPVYEAFKPLITNVLLIGFGMLLAFILGKINNYRRTNDSRIIITISFITILVALSSINYSSFNYYLPFTNISPLLPCMAFGILYFNYSKSESLFIQLENFLPPILCLFFVISGAKLQLTNFSNISIVVMALVFVIFRSGSQFGSLYTFGRIFKCHKNTFIYLTLTMLTMTSVAVGLINLAISILPSGNAMINYVYTVVLTACVILEIIGPVFAKIALIKTNSADPVILMQLSDPKAARRVENGNVTSD